MAEDNGPRIIGQRPYDPMSIASALIATIKWMVAGSLVLFTLIYLIGYISRLVARLTA